MSALIPALERLPVCEFLLVVSDFDGTLAGFSPNPDDVAVHTPSMDALHALSALPNTSVALLSGRSVESLRAASGVCRDSAIALVGSHGAQREEGARVSPELQRCLDEVAQAWERLIASSGCSGAFVEHKPYHRVFHVRGVTDAAVAEALLRRAAGVGCSRGGFSEGKCVVEYSPIAVTKGDWLREQVEGLPTGAGVVFIGDDVTDEHGFSALRALESAGHNGVLRGVKVGDGVTEAHATVAGIREVGEMLSELAKARQIFIKEHPRRPAHWRRPRRGRQEPRG